jgi:hypothetical protein
MSNYTVTRAFFNFVLVTMVLGYSTWTSPDSPTSEQAVVEGKQNQALNSYHNDLLVINGSNINQTVSLPLSKGYVNGKVAFFIATDASDNETANSIFENTGFKVNVAPALSQIPQTLLGQGFEFLNGMLGQGAFGYQLPVTSSLPGDKEYSPLVQLNLVRWNENTIKSVLKSTEEIYLAYQKGDVQITPTNIIINSPAVKW